MYADSLLQLSCCDIEYAEELLFIPLDKVFSGRGGGVLDGEEDD